ncbi:MAG: M48 family metallopeptidase [Candidatus Omnitrophica bacterium]|nr:M48 family metallopeptidase [Candidatus Omnitrophota bacterium]
MQQVDKVNLAAKAQRYSSLKYTLSIVETVYFLIILLLFAGTGASRILAEVILNFTTNYYIILPLYLLSIGILFYFLNFPLSFYHSYILEHEFSLSNQKVIDWLKDQIKSGAISYIIGVILIGTFYYILRGYSNIWWLIVSLFWIFFNLLLAKLTPVIIIPLFFKYKKLANEGLRERIMNLAKRMKVRILDCYEIDFSKKTLKANAAFVGMGKTRRVLLADTLTDKYSDDEIEVILAHEFSHYKLKHLLKLVLVSSTATILTFYLIFRTNDYILGLFGFDSLSEIAALPVVFIYFVIFGIIMRPFENYIIRRMERNADKLALKITGFKDGFISMMDKLATQNLADRKPHPLIKFFFFDHPPIDERILIAKNLQS